MKHISYIVFIFFCLSCQKNALDNRSIPGVIFSQEQTVAEWPFSKSMSAWTPTKAQIIELEEKLGSYIQASNHPEALNIANKLPSYRRQYLGITENGKNLIYINAFCDSYKSTFDTSNTHFVFVFDGGACFFQVTYDPVTKAFIKLSINGVA
jgi:hypothetical protein